jgi:two-component system, LytTR family, response regulator
VIPAGPRVIDVIIVDDEPAGRRALREYCEAEADLRVIGEYRDGEAALAAIRERPPELLFLDVQMNPLSGIELARALDPTAFLSIVFVTAFDSYALEAFEVSAVDYLLKPFDQARFRKMLARVRARQPAVDSEQRRAALADLLARFERSTRALAVDRPRLLAESNGQIHLLNVNEVELIEADRNYVRIRIGRSTYHARSTLQQAEQVLQSQPMLRISRSCLVNMNFVREVNRTLRGDFILVLAGGTTVTSSEGFRGKVKEFLGTLRIAPSEIPRT